MCKGKVTRLTFEIHQPEKSRWKKPVMPTARLESYTSSCLIRYLLLMFCRTPFLLHPYFTLLMFFVYCLMSLINSTVLFHNGKWLPVFCGTGLVKMSIPGHGLLQVSTGRQHLPTCSCQISCCGTQCLMYVLKTKKGVAPTPFSCTLWHCHVRL